MSDADAAEKARQDVAACEKEIGAIKATLRSLGPASADEASEAGNSMKVVLLKVHGLPESAKARLTLQLSSPIEEAVLSEVYDPSSHDGGSDSAEDASGGVATFRGVETGQATLTVTCADADIPLGTSASYDIATMTKVDAMEPKKEYVTEITVPIFPEGKVPSDPKDAEASPDCVCTLTLRLTYRPSTKDQREELYELLNKTTQRKAVAVEKLRQIALSASRQQALSQPQSKPSKPAVRAGFLNKAKKDEKSRLRAWYDQNLGPESIVRRVWPVAQNYVIFFAAVGFFHFKGQLLALPPPV